MRLGYIFPSEQKVESPEANPCKLLPFYNKDATSVSQLFNLHLQDIFTPKKRFKTTRSNRLTVFLSYFCLIGTHLFWVIFVLTYRFLVFIFIYYFEVKLSSEQTLWVGKHQYGQKRLGRCFIIGTITQIKEGSLSRSMVMTITTQRSHCFQRV